MTQCFCLRILSWLLVYAITCLDVVCGVEFDVACAWRCVVALVCHVCVSRVYVYVRCVCDMLVVAMSCDVDSVWNSWQCVV